MIKAVLKNGAFQPLEALPTTWRDGQEVVVDEAEETSSADLDRWYEELEALGGARYEPGEREQIQIMMAEADEQAKAFIRRQMGLP